MRKTVKSSNSNEENWHVYVILSKITKSLKPVPRTDTFSQKISQSWKKKKKKKEKKEENSSNSARKRNEAIERAAVVKMLEARPERHNNQPAPKIARGARSPPTSPPNLYLLLHYLLWPRMIPRACGVGRRGTTTGMEKKCSLKAGGKRIFNNPRELRLASNCEKRDAKNQTG